MAKTGHSATYEEVQKLHPFYFNVVKKRYWWFALSLLIVIPGIISFLLQGLNLGIGPECFAELIPRFLLPAKYCLKLSCA